VSLTCDAETLPLSSFTKLYSVASNHSQTAPISQILNTKLVFETLLDSKMAFKQHQGINPKEIDSRTNHQICFPPAN
jgi:hypothetical protein